MYCWPKPIPCNLVFFFLFGPVLYLNQSYPLINPDVSHSNRVLSTQFVGTQTNRNGVWCSPLFFFFCILTLINVHIYILHSRASLQCEWFTTVSVHHGVRAKTVDQTCTCITCTCDRCGVKGGRYGVTQSHLQCDHVTPYGELHFCK